MKKTAEEILAVLKTLDSVSDVAYGDFDVKALGLGEVKMNIHKEGGEGKGEDWRRVHYFVDHDIFIEVNGHYVSHDGVNFYDDFEDHVRAVRPVEKTITVYE